MFSDASLQELFRELGIETIETPTILEDNEGVVHNVNGTGGNPSSNKTWISKKNTCRRERLE
ncbi:hypothetical protein HF325_002225 [Metschnikowia pulcherrima]|uniref:Uncharacterized protein n=1 Tax=Metschnikowia pulcherrima TaxID=27326 RepID=A0A8H7GTR1_9ASCO|nr:hypothetical protein HF325_002225 [Metschnikowia pulcherrima]